MSSEKKRPIRVAITPKIAAKIIELPAVWLAFSFWFFPSKREIKDWDPTPVPVAMPARIICIGKTIERAEIAAIPSLPTKIVSTKL